MDKFIKPCLLHPSFKISTEEKFTAELTATHNEAGDEAKQVKLKFWSDEAIQCAVFIYDLYIRLTDKLTVKLSPLYC